MNRRGLLLAGAAGVLVAGCGKDGRPAQGAADDAAVLAGLLGLERRAVAIYERQESSLAARLLAHEREHVERLQDALPRLRDPGLRRLLAGIAAVEAEHLSAVAAALGEPAAPAAFVRGRDAL